MNFRFFGNLNLVLLVIVLLPYVLNFLNRRFFKTKNETYRNAVKLARAVHKPAGIILLVFGLVHGYMAFRSVRFHTGTVLYALIIVQAVLGGALYRKKSKALFKAHRVTALVVAALFLLHWLVPSALSGLFN